jgi:hypothetical protein
VKSNYEHKVRDYAQRSRGKKKWVKDEDKRNFILDNLNMKFQLDIKVEVLGE